MQYWTRNDFLFFCLIFVMDKLNGIKGQQWSCEMIKNSKQTVLEARLNLEITRRNSSGPFPHPHPHLRSRDATNQYAYRQKLSANQWCYWFRAPLIEYDALLNPKELPRSAWEGIDREDRTNTMPVWRSIKQSRQSWQVTSMQQGT